MKKVFYCIYVIYFFTYCNLAFSQRINTLFREDNFFIQSKVEKCDTMGWLFFSDSCKLQPGDLFEKYKQYTGLSSYDEMRQKSINSDKYGWSHTKYEQYYKGIKVQGCEWSEHWQDCCLKIAHGKLVEGLNISIIPTVSFNDAVSLATRAISANKYAWQDSEWEKNIKEEEGNESATYYPEQELIISRINGNDFDNSNYGLVWKFQILSLDPFSIYDIIVDANTGDILFLEQSGNYNGPANLLYSYGSQILDTKPKLWYYILKADDEGRDITTKYGTGPEVFSNNGTNFFWQSNVSDDDDDWGFDEQYATTAHWVVTKAWDYYNQIHGRNGFNNQGVPVRVWADSGDENNARHFNFKGNEYLEFGNATPSGNTFATLDIAGHEFTHGVIAYTSGLGHFREPGALNESFCDIFGVLVERQSSPNGFNWEIGDEIGIGNLRSLINPQSTFCPDTYLGLFWHPTDLTHCPNISSDCGIHFNCGVQNYWFYLLANGGFHNGVKIFPIGIDKAAQITYLSMVSFMQEESQFFDARESAIAAARIIFGPCSFEEIQVTNAWSACGVGGLFQGPCLTVQGPKIICFPLTKPIIFTAFDLPGSTFQWQFPNNWIAYTYGNGNKFLKVMGLGEINSLPIQQTIKVISSNGQVFPLLVNIRDCKGKDICNDFLILRDNSINLDNEFQDINFDSNYVIFPNPVSDILLIENLKMEEPIKELTIFDIYGNKLYYNSNEISEKDIFELNISNLSSGVYFIILESLNNSVIKKFIKSE